jgi:hypothetical protein
MPAPIETEHKRVTGRAFAYTSASLVIGVVIYIFTSPFLIYTERPGLTGTLALAVYALVFLNVNFVLSRRFTAKTGLFPYFPYFISLLIILPTLILSILTEKFLFQSSLFILGTVLFLASLLGARLGLLRGAVKRNELKKELPGSRVSDDLKHPHHHINRN